jgi:lysylphosphatidylglycerol synthetase-like protein (DUF2156 family)
MSTITKENYSTETEVAPLPNGPAAAAILAGGIGSAWYGLMVCLSEWFPSVSKAFTLSKGVGPLSGKTTFGMLGFLAAWAILASMWKGKDVNLDKAWKISLGLIVLALIFTFPTFFLMFAPE